MRLDDPNARLAEGDRLKVSHDFLLYDGHVVGYLEVISIGPRGAVARPIGSLQLTAVSRGDQATLEVAAPVKAVPQLNSARRLPPLETGPVVSR